MSGDENPFDEFFRQLGENFPLSQEEVEAKVQKEIDYAASVAWRLMESYIRHGFTVEQAFELVKIQLQTLSSKRR